jgi:hypothetical protein
MASPDFQIVQLLQEQYLLDVETATELARNVDGKLREMLQVASSALSTRGMDPEEAPRVLTSDHIKHALRGFEPTVGPSSHKPAFVRADGDGNCLNTTLALDMEMKVRATIHCLTLHTPLLSHVVSLPPCILFHCSAA